MTNRERFSEVLSFRPVDRPPNYELGCWGQTIERWQNEGLPSDSLHWNWFEGEPYLNLDRRGFARVNAGMLPRFEPEIYEETDRFVTSRNSKGIITKALKAGMVRGTRASMDNYISFPVKDRESFEQIKKRYNPLSAARYPLWWDEWVKIWEQRDYPLCLFENASFGLYSRLREWTGTEGLSYLFYDEPAFVEEMAEFITEFAIALFEKALSEASFDYFNFFEDFAGKGGPLISPGLFKKFLMPCYKKIIERLKLAGVKHFLLDSDGDFEVLIPLLIESGITCIWPLEQASGMDPVRLRKTYGDSLAFAGGIDKRKLARGRDAIDAELYGKLPPLLERGGYIPHLDHTFPPDISCESFLYYLRLKEKLISGL